MKLKSLVSAAAVALATASPAHAALLAGVSGQVGTSINAAGSGFVFVDELSVIFAVLGQPSSGVLINQIIDGDTSISVTSGQGFTDAVSLLTNGLSNDVILANDFVTTLGVIPSSGTDIREAESVYFAGQPGLTGTDFAGATIDEFVFTVENFDAFTGVEFGIISYDYTFEVFGDFAAANPVPIPAAAPLFAGGVAFPLTRNRRKRAGASR